MVNKYYQKTKKNFKKKHRKGTKIFLKKKKKKDEKKRQADIKIFLKSVSFIGIEEKQKKVERMRNYYLTHKKINFMVVSS